MKAALPQMNDPCENCPGEQACTMRDEDRLRRKLKYFFMDPCHKWKAKRKFPWKLVLQIIKIILVTIQLALFGYLRAAHVDFIEKGNISFKHLYLKRWDASYETMPYPPSTGTYAVYDSDDFYAHIDYALTRYNLTSQLALGPYDKSTPFAMLCKRYFVDSKSFAFNQSYIYDSDITEECILMKPFIKENQSHYDSRRYLSQIDKSIYFDSLVSVTLHLDVKTVHIKSYSKNTLPECYQFNITMSFDNSGHNGQITVKLQLADYAIPCHGNSKSKSDEILLIVVTSIFDVLIIIISSMSMCLCARSIYNANQLCKEVVRFFWRVKGVHLTSTDKMEFLNMWYVLIIINDTLTVVGSVMKITMQNQMSHSYEICGVLLGTGNLLVWFGVLRYLNFYEKYSILIMTLKKSIPNMLRFLTCAGVFYMGFTVCGWVVLGPYHIKFRYLSSSSECLFSLINGDDMYNTFEAISAENVYAWWYSRLYLYSFISFFMYVVVNVFLSVIMDTYETIKHYSECGYPRTFLEKFTDECTDTPRCLFASSRRRGDGSCTASCSSCLQSCLPFLRKRRDSDFDDENEPLIS